MNTFSSLPYIYKKNSINGDIFLFLSGYNQPFVSFVKTPRSSPIVPPRTSLRPRLSADFFERALCTAENFNSISADRWIRVCVCVCRRNRKRHIIPSEVSALPGTVPNSSRTGDLPDSLESCGITTVIFPFIDSAED